MSDNYLFTSESVTEGHPDKVADRVSDSVLDALIAQDKRSRVACETLVTTGMAVIAGEITTAANIDVPAVVREAIRDIGYTDPEMGFEWQTCAVLVALGKQSVDIALGVDESNAHEQGAGDQGLMFGFATNETEELMPMPIIYAHKLTQQLAKVRKDKTLDFVRPDGKSQVSVRYEKGVPVAIDAVVISTQHTPTVTRERIVEGIMDTVIKPIIPANLLHKDTKYFINPTGRFVIGGPMGDCGLTGRKIIVDTYGGQGSHGGGAFSGKDPSKVDRSASYMGRYVAKNIVASGLAKKCEIQIAYAIGVAEPVSVMVDTFGTGKISHKKISDLVREVFQLKPKEIIAKLDLLRPIYAKTSAYGHFGRNDPDFTWEKTDMADKLRDLAGIK